MEEINEAEPHNNYEQILALPCLPSVLSNLTKALFRVPCVVSHFLHKSSEFACSIPISPCVECSSRGFSSKIVYDMVALTQCLVGCIRIHALLWYHDSASVRVSLGGVVELLLDFVVN